MCCAPTRGSSIGTIAKEVVLIFLPARGFINGVLHVIVFDRVVVRVEPRWILISEIGGSKKTVRGSIEKIRGINRILCSKGLVGCAVPFQLHGSVNGLPNTDVGDEMVERLASGRCLIPMLRNNVVIFEKTVEVAAGGAAPILVRCMLALTLLLQSSNSIGGFAFFEKLKKRHGQICPHKTASKEKA